MVIGGFGGTDYSCHPNTVEIGGWAVLPWEYKCPVQEYILGIDILRGLVLQTTVGEFRLRERCFSIWMVQVILRGHVKHELFACPIHAGLLIPNSIDSRGQEENSGMVQELEKEGIVGLAH